MVAVDVRISFILFIGGGNMLNIKNIDRVSKGFTSVKS
jgi:hypothetical protein